MTFRKHLTQHQQIADHSNKWLTMPLTSTYKPPIKGQSWGFHCERDNPCLPGGASAIDPFLIITDGGTGKIRVCSSNLASEEIGQVQNTHTCLYASLCFKICSFALHCRIFFFQDFFFILLQFFMFCLLSFSPFSLPGHLFLETIPSLKHPSDFLCEAYTNIW